MQKHLKFYIDGEWGEHGFEEFLETKAIILPNA